MNRLLELLAMVEVDVRRQGELVRHWDELDNAQRAEMARLDDRLGPVEEALENYAEHFDR